MIRVLIADDQDLIRIGLRRLVASEPDLTVVGEAADGLSAVELARRERPDVVLMDVRMPLSNEEIGARLTVSPATARTHVSRAMLKLGRDRARLVVFAYQSGLVTP